MVQHTVIGSMKAYKGSFEKVCKQKNLKNIIKERMIIIITFQKHLDIVRNKNA